MTPASRKKILFVTPPYHSGIPELAGSWVPLNFVYLAGSAREAGLEAEIYDAATKNHGYGEIEKRLLASGADYVASSAITATVKDALKTLELAKRVKPGTVTILGGVHATFMYEEILTSSSAVDYVIIGEGELTLRQLVSVLEQGGDPASVPGLAYRHGDAVVATAKRSPAENLDELPAAWDLLEWPDYKYLVIPDSRFGAISTSRGCDHGCTFCSQQRFWEKSWRARDPRKVAEEVEHLHTAYGVSVFLITDEYASRSRERWEELLDALIAKELGVYFIMESRPSDIVRDADILWKYRKAGIIHIGMGIESTEQARLDLLKKGMQLDEAKQAIDLVHEHGIVTEVSFLIGFPDETPEGIKAALKLAQQYNPDNANFYPVTPWPYSELYAELKPYIKETEYDKYNLISPVVEPKQMTLRQIDVAIVDCFRKFYMGKFLDVMTMKDPFKRSYLLRATKLIMSSSFVVKKMSAGTFGKIPAKMDEISMRRKA